MPKTRQNHLIAGARVPSSLLGAAILSSFGLTPYALAQEGGRALVLEEVIVTAQKREESMQDVPVAVTAVTQEAIQTNRIFTVADLSGIAPNATVRPTPGGVAVPSFNIRGINSQGVVTGSDKQVSLYLDGVYLGSARGSIFTLPDIVQLEILRGPQGTLFGRNATAGAVNIRTRDPNGELGFKQVLEFGNNDHFRSRTTFDTPAWGPLSAYLTYVTEERDGGSKNLGAGTVWDRSGFGLGVDRSPDTLGDTDTENWFAAVLYEPTDNFSLSYKFDYGEDTGNQGVQANISLEADLEPIGAGAFDPLIDALKAANAEFPEIYPNISRPDAYNNAWTVDRDQENLGHNLTAIWDINEAWTSKTILAYRKTELFAPSDISGTSGWVVGSVGAGLPSIPGTPIDGPYPPDTRYCYVCSQSDLKTEQWSAEFQFNYSHDFVDLTLGALYYKQEDEGGSPVNSANSFALFDFLPADGTIPTGGEARDYVDSESVAAYAHGVFHVLPALDLVLGYRHTWDDKSGYNRQGDPGDYKDTHWDYDDDRPSYTLGVNYRPTDDMLLYAKFEASYVSGGSVGSLGFEPEEAESWEVGMKADFLDNRLRSNLALFHVEYDKVQTAQQGINVPGAEEFATVIVEGGDLEVEGVELELTALATEGLTLGLTVGYSNPEFTRSTDLLLASVQGRETDRYPTDEYRQYLHAEWTGNVNARYETGTLFDEAYMTFDIMGIWRDDMLMQPNETRANGTPQYKAAEYSPDTWVVNARIALTNLRLGDWSGEVALWGRNLTDDDEPTFMLNTFGNITSQYNEERIYGIEFTVEY